MRIGFALLFLFFVINSSKAQQLRLLEFNETFRQWVPLEEVEKMAAAPHKNFIDITDFPLLGSKPNKIFPAIPIAPSHQAEVFPLLEKLSPTQLQAQIQKLSSYPTRYYTSTSGLQAVRDLLLQYTTYAVGRDDIEIIDFQNTYLQPSIIARIQGVGPSADEVVIIGGHVDSTSSSGAAPGADDDASGSSTVLEIFRVLAEQNFKPQRTLEFHGYAAEEVGLRGSQAIVQQYLNQGIVVAAMMQLDMTGYHPASTTPTIGIITDYTNPALSAFVRALVDTYTTTPWRNTQCGYGCSDHASWYRAGYPASFPFEGLFSNSNPNIHTSRDLLSVLDLDHAFEFAKLGLSFLVELSYASS
jgi:leucyl aminopeptidase